MKNSFVLYAEYAKHISILSMEQRGVLFTAIMAYSAGEELPEMDGMTQIAFSFIKEQLDRDKERYEATCKKRSEAGKQGGRPKEEKQMLSEESKKSKCFFEKANESNEKQKNPDNDNEDEDEDDNEDDIYSSLPPMIPHAEGEEEKSKCLKSFLARHKNVSVDNCSTASLDLDYGALEEEFAESEYLSEKPHDLSWVAKNAQRIIRGDFRNKRPCAPPGKGDLQLWRELVNALKRAKETRYSEKLQQDSELFRMADDEAKREMGELYKSLSAEIVDYFEPNSFLELCRMTDEELKYERARFLKALPDTRRRISGGG